MFPSFISILDIQSWWEVPSIAHFCSLFRAAFNLLDFDIEELEEALLTDGTEDAGSSLLQELIVRLLCGCLGNNDISTFNYQMFLRRLFRQKCQEAGRYNPFNTDIDFQFLPLRTKVEILHTLCDFRLDAEDVLNLLKNLEAESLRVEPLGYDDNYSAYWYFYGTRLYREDYDRSVKKTKHSHNHRKTVWQVVCFTEQDWTTLTSKFKKATSKTERALHRTLSEYFLPEIPRLFQEKERQQRKRLLDSQPRRTSSRVQKQRTQEDIKPSIDLPEIKEEQVSEEIIEKDKATLSARELRALQRDACKSIASDSDADSRSESPIPDNDMAPTQKSERASADRSGLTSLGRQTNNSLASATGQILIQPSTKPKKHKNSQVFRQTEEDLQTGMYKILEYVKNHDDAWPFIDPVEEDYAPNYYSVVRKPMDLQRMEDKLDAGEYQTFKRFRADFQLIVDNCQLYNGKDNEYTEMVDNLQQAFQRATDRFLDQITSSDDENPNIPQIAIEPSKIIMESNITEEKLELKDSKTNKAAMLSSPKVEEKKLKVKRGWYKRYKIFGSTDVSENSEPIVSKKEGNTKTKKLKSNTPAKQQDSTKKESKIPKKLERSRSRSRSRSVSNARSWVSSPSPPPPRIQKKKRCKEKLVAETTIEIIPKTPKLEIIKREPTKHVEEVVSEMVQKKKKQSENYPSTTPQISKPKNLDLAETIEKLKKNNIISKKHQKERLRKVKSKENRNHKLTEIETETKNNKKVKNLKNTAAIKALDLATEQTLKDINKWLDDTPKFSELSNSPSSHSPLPLTSLEEFDLAATNLETEYKNQQILQKEQDIKSQLSTPPVPSVDTRPGPSPSTTTTATSQFVIPQPTVPVTKAKEIQPPLVKEVKRRPVPKEKIQKRREIQRTIDRLQPGKSKGNLIANRPNNKEELNSTLFGSNLVTGLATKIKDAKNSQQIQNQDSSIPKLSLGTVLDSFGEQHNFVDTDKDPGQEIIEKEKPETESNSQTELKPDNKEESKNDLDNKSSNCDSTNEKSPPKIVSKQESVTPNLSAWFKAFGAPKPAHNQRKKQDNSETLDSAKTAESVITPVIPEPNDVKVPSPISEISPNVQPAPRTRKASTGSTISERSSFSQDMDSPRLTVEERLGYPAPFPSPLTHRSPASGGTPNRGASPSMENLPENYPSISGNMRVGFYQDTVKSSPEKSCSPLEGAQSPHNPPHYPHHVYIPPVPTAYHPQYTNQQPSPPSQSPIHSQSAVAPLSPVPYLHQHHQEYYEDPVYNQIPSSVPQRIYEPPAADSPKPQVIPNEEISQTSKPVKKRLYSETNNPEIYREPAMQQPSFATDLKKYDNRLNDNRGLNLQIPSESSLNIPNPKNQIKTIDLTGPDSPVYSNSNSTTMNMPLDIYAHPHHQQQSQYNTLIDNRISDLSQARISASADLRIPNISRTSAPDNPDYQNRLSFGLDTLNSLRSLHMVDRYHHPANDERLLSSLGSPQTHHLYYDKTVPVSLFPKTMMSAPTTISNPVVSSSSMQPHQELPYNLQTNNLKSTQAKKEKKRKSKMASPIPAESQGFQSYAGLKSNSPHLEPKSSSVVPGSAFNFGPTPLTTDNYPGYHLDDFHRSNSNYYIAAALQQQRSTPDLQQQPTHDKTQQRIPQVTNPTQNPTYPTFLTHPGQRTGPPTTFVNPFLNHMDASSAPLYQQYLHRHQEELLRQHTVMHQGLLGGPPPPTSAYPPGYPPLNMRQTFDAINRPSWL